MIPSESIYAVNLLSGWFRGTWEFQHIEFRMEMNSLSFFDTTEFYFADKISCGSRLYWVLPFALKWSPASINQPVMLADLLSNEYWLTRSHEFSKCDVAAVSMVFASFWKEFLFLWVYLRWSWWLSSFGCWNYPLTECNPGSNRFLTSWGTWNYACAYYLLICP